MQYFEVQHCFDIINYKYVLASIASQMTEQYKTFGQNITLTILYVTTKKRDYIGDRYNHRK